MLPCTRLLTLAVKLTFSVKYDTSLSWTLTRKFEVSRSLGQAQQCSKLCRLSDVTNVTKRMSNLYNRVALLSHNNVNFQNVYGNSISTLISSVLATIPRHLRVERARAVCPRRPTHAPPLKTPPAPSPAHFNNSIIFESLLLKLSCTIPPTPVAPDPSFQVFKTPLNATIHHTKALHRLP